MSVSSLRNHPRLTVATVLLVAVASLAAWQRTDAVGQESADKPNPAALEHANMLSEAFNHAAEVAMPSVVTIYSKTKAQPVSGVRPNRGQNPFKGTPFEEFFEGRDFEQFGQQMPNFPRQGMGSGVIIDRSGIVLTNNHVVEGADEVVVHLADGRDFEAENIKTDKQTDLAVLQIKGAGTLPAATLGDSDKLKIGDWVMAIGNPFELEQTVSAGIISGKGRDLPSSSNRDIRTRFLQTDAAINPGNSGGPLVDLHGQVVGINTAIATNTGTYSGIGFAVPVNVAKWVTNQLINKGKVERAYLGVGIKPISPEMAQAFGARPGIGALVTQVQPNMPAAQAGITAGDIITKFDGVAVSGPGDLQQLVERVNVGDKKDVEILRDGKPMTLSVAPKPMPDDVMFASRQRPLSGDETPQQGEAFEASEIGLQVSDLTEERAAEAGLKPNEGVLITSVEPNSPAFEKGLREGMVVLKVGKQDVKSVAEFEAALKDHSLEKGILLYVHARNGNDFVLLKD
jgi:serine protease Do